MALDAGAGHTCARLNNGQLECWGFNVYGQLGNGNTTTEVTPQALSSSLTNNGLMASEGTVLVNEYSTTGSGSPDSGHVMPVPWSMMDTKTGTESLMVTYDPLAAAAALFIEQYDSHIAACNATTSETMVTLAGTFQVTNGSATVSTSSSQVGVLNVNDTLQFTSQSGTTYRVSSVTSTGVVLTVAYAGSTNSATTVKTITEASQKAGTYLVACSNATAKSNYLSGMQTFLNGARHYLFGSDTGCIKSTQTVGGVACGTTTFGPDPTHFPYTLFVPAYTTSVYNSQYYGQISSAITSYQNAVIASGGTRLERTLQLAGAQQFSTNNALVTSTVLRTEAYGTSCITGSDGFTYQ